MALLLYNNRPPSEWDGVPDFIKEHVMSEKNETPAAPVFKRRAKPGEAAAQDTEQTETPAAVDTPETPPADGVEPAAAPATPETPPAAPDPTPDAAKAPELPAAAATADNTPSRTDPAFLAHVEKVRAAEGPSAVEKVLVTVAKVFKMQLDAGVTVHFLQGVQQVERFLADHWYAKANGLSPYTPPGTAAPVAVPAQAYEEMVVEVRAGRVKLQEAIDRIAAFYKVEAAAVRDEFSRYAGK